MSRVMAPTCDDLGVAVSLPGSIDRVVSLVPSLTESLAVSAPGLLVGATDWCTHPADLDVTRIGGTKNPDVAGIVALAPDLVLANEEENRAADLDALREAGVAVWVTQVRTVDEAFTSLARMLAACGVAPRALARRRRGGLGGGRAGCRPDRRDPHLATPVDGARRGHIRRGRPGPPGHSQCIRRQRRALSAGGARVVALGGPGRAAG